MDIGRLTCRSCTSEAMRRRRPRGRTPAAALHAATQPRPASFSCWSMLVGQLVEAFVDRHFLGHHLLQRLRPLGGQVEEQRLRREVDLRARRRDVVLVRDSPDRTCRCGSRNSSSFQTDGADRVDEVHLARAEQVMLGRGRPLHEVPGGVLLAAEKLDMASDQIQTFGVGAAGRRIGGEGA